MSSCLIFCITFCLETEIQAYWQEDSAQWKVGVDPYKVSSSAKFYDSIPNWAVHILFDVFSLTCFSF